MRRKLYVATFPEPIEYVYRSVQNGSIHQKDAVNDDDFEPYLSSQTNQSNSYPPMSDPYMPSYYAPSIGFPYSLGEAAWSTAGDPPMPYLTTYGQMSNDFSTWGTSGSQGQSTQSSAYSSSYGYPPSSLGRAIADGQAGFGSDTLSKVPGISSIEQGMTGLKIGGDMTAAVTKTVGSALSSTGMTSIAANSVPPVSSSAPKPTSWAAIARKPAKPQPKLKPKGNVGIGGPAVPPPPIKHNMNIGTWDDKGSSPSGVEVHPVLEKLKAINNYNPKDFDWNLKNGRVFIIKSYSEDDIHRSIKYSIWCSTEHGNKRLDAAYRSLNGKGPLYLLFSVNGSGHFCGVAEMKSVVDYNAYAGVWSQDKWKGKFDVKWIFVKDVPNNQLRHIRLENNDNKPVTNSRDTQEVPLEKAKQVLKIIATFKHTTSIFDDFAHYEKRQEEEEAMRRGANAPTKPKAPNLLSGDTEGLSLSSVCFCQETTERGALLGGTSLFSCLSRHVLCLEALLGDVSRKAGVDQRWAAQVFVLPPPRELKSDMVVSLLYVTPYFVSAPSISRKLLKSAAQLHYTWSGAGFPEGGGKRQVVSSHDQGFSLVWMNANVGYTSMARVEDASTPVGSESDALNLTHKPADVQTTPAAAKEQWENRLCKEVGKLSSSRLQDGTSH
ncbi:hypothetical protein IHE44_0001018 [Lamprotornis superbus]|uniref:YTH domain-containing family protein n=1 Tax=Lamprotornis superbus TaxID=245042 RepID=A0A835NUF9_9PASS|nr:hypothetical protein IHE44_0001018 [Lamprotornis superbus]